MHWQTFTVWAPNAWTTPRGFINHCNKGMEREGEEREEMRKRMREMIRPCTHWFTPYSLCNTLHNMSVWPPARMKVKDGILFAIKLLCFHREHNTPSVTEDTRTSLWKICFLNTTYCVLIALTNHSSRKDYIFLNCLN